MRTQDYDQENKCCKLCGVLLPFTPQDMEAHTLGDCLKNKVHADERIKSWTKIPTKDTTMIKVDKVIEEKDMFSIWFTGAVSYSVMPNSVFVRLTTEELNKLGAYIQAELQDKERGE